MEATKSSAWRELEAIRYFLESNKKSLKNKHLKWYTYNRTSNTVAKSGSNKIEP